MSLTFVRDTQLHPSGTQVFVAKSPSLHSFGDAPFGAAVLADLMNVRAWCASNLSEGSWTIDGRRKTWYPLTFDGIDCHEGEAQDTEREVRITIDDLAAANSFASHFHVS